MTQEAVVGDQLYTNTTSMSWNCRYDGKPCELVPFIGGHLQRAVDEYDGDRWDEAEEYLKNPMAAVERDMEESVCWRCRGGEYKAEALKGVRLGKHERRVFLAAPPPRGGSEVIPPPEKTRASAEANKRAISKLAKIGLIKKGVKNVEIQQLHPEHIRRRYKPEYHRHRVRKAMVSVELTWFGANVRNVIHDDLKDEKPIRWGPYVDNIISMIRLRGDEMVHRVKVLRSAVRNIASFYSLDDRIGAMLLPGMSRCPVRKRTKWDAKKVGFSIVRKALDDWALDQRPDLTPYVADLARIVW